MIFACYRRDEAHDPEVYCAAVAAVLGDYPRDVIDVASDPRTGIAAEHKFMPAVAEVKSFCQAALERRERLKKYAALPKFERRPSAPPSIAPNLFVPIEAPRYSKMAEKAAAEPHRARFERGHVCADGALRDGYWIPLEWWQSEDMDGLAAMRAAAQRAFQRECQAEGIDPGRGVSPSLLKLLGEQNADA